MKPVTIGSIDDPRLKPFCSLKNKHIEREGLFIGESVRVIKALLKNKYSIHSILTTPELYKKFKKELSRENYSKTQIYYASDSEIEKIVGFRYHQGIIVCAHLKDKLGIRERADIFKKPHLAIALDGIRDPQNVGLIMRSAAGFGVDAVIVDSRTCDPFYRQAVRVSIGGVFSVPVCYEADLASSLRYMKKKFKTKIVVTSLGTGTKDLSKADLSRNICLVFGNEDHGARPEIIKLADQKVKIPISNVDSLNVAATAAICLWHASI